MPTPTQTFATIQDLINYINTYVVPNANQEITGEIENNVENGLANFIVKYTLNSELVAIESSGGVVVLPAPMSVFTTVLPTSVQWDDNIQNEYYVVNSLSQDIPIAAGFLYYDQTLTPQTAFPAQTSVHIAKATNGHWIQVGGVAAGAGIPVPVPINKGGTGQVTANAALNALLPNQAGNNGKFLKTDGSNSTWQFLSGNQGLSVDGSGNLVLGQDTVANTGPAQLNSDRAIPLNAHTVIFAGAVDSGNNNDGVIIGDGVITIVGNSQDTVPAKLNFVDNNDATSASIAWGNDQLIINGFQIIFTPDPAANVSVSGQLLATTAAISAASIVPGYNLQVGAVFGTSDLLLLDSGTAGSLRFGFTNTLGLTVLCNTSVVGADISIGIADTSAGGSLGLIVTQAGHGQLAGGSGIVLDFFGDNCSLLNTDSGGITTNTFSSDIFRVLNKTVNFQMMRLDDQAKTYAMGDMGATANGTIITIDDGTETLDLFSNVAGNTAYSIQGNKGATGTFTSADAKTITVQGGIITSIV